jgi:hypothetical protein
VLHNYRYAVYTVYRDVSSIFKSENTDKPLGEITDIDGRFSCFFSMRKKFEKNVRHSIAGMLKS